MNEDSFQSSPQENEFFILKKDLFSIERSMGEESAEVDRIAAVLQSTPEAFELDLRAVQLVKVLRKHFTSPGNSINDISNKFKLFQSQLMGNETLFIALAKFFNETKLLKNKVKDKLTIINQNSEKTLFKYQEAIQKLKEQELHPAFCQNKFSKVIDLYYSPEKMEKWKNGCESNLASLNKRFSNQCEELKSLKNCILEQNNDVKQWTLSAVEFEEKLESELNLNLSLIESFVQTFSESFIEFRKRLQSSISGKDQTLSSSFCQQFKEKLSVFESEAEGLKKSLDSLNKLSKDFDTWSISMRDRLMKTFLVVNALLIKTEKLKKDFTQACEKDCDKIDKDFSYLLKPCFFPAAYEALLTEISRRRAVLRALRSHVDQFTQIINGENSKRSDFLASFGNILPDSFKELIPSLKESLGCSVNVSFEEYDRLPTVDLEADYNMSFDDSEKLVIENTRKMLDFLAKELKQREEFKEIEVKSLKDENESFRHRVKEIESRLIESIESEATFEEMLKISQHSKKKIEEVKFLVDSLKKEATEIKEIPLNYRKELEEAKQLISQTKLQRTESLKSLELEDEFKKIKNQQEEQILCLISRIAELEKFNKELSDQLSTQLEKTKKEIDVKDEEILKLRKITEDNQIESKIEIKAIEKQLRDAIAKLSEELKSKESQLDSTSESFRKEISELKSTLISKEDTIKTSQDLLGHSVSLAKQVYPGDTLLFIPFAQGVYIRVSMGFGPEGFAVLDLNTLESKFKNILKANSFIVIGKLKEASEVKTLNISGFSLQAREIILNELTALVTFDESSNVPSSPVNILSLVQKL